MEELKEKLINYLIKEEFSEKKILSEKDLNEKFKEIINQINFHAPVKIISNNKNDNQIIEIFNEIVDELRKIDLQNKIELLENKVSLNLDESLYKELLSLRNQLKGG